MAINDIAIAPPQTLSSNADLSNLILSQGTLSPTFASGTTTYTASVGNAVSSLTVTPTVADATATLKVNGASATNGTGTAVALNVGSNTITVLVTAQDGTPNTYTVTVTRAASSNADLSNLTLSQGTLSPTFASGTTTYTASVSNAVSSLTVTPTVADATATLKVNGVAATNGNGSTVALNVGSNTITVLVTAQDGTPNTYTVTVTRAASSNADLSNLTLSQGTLSPTFASGTTTYTASVSIAVSSLTVTPTVADATATLKVNGVAATNGNGSTVALNVGSNTITVLVTAQDGTPNTYTITVTRAASSNADLSSLTLSQGTLSPTFASGTTTYTASVGNAVSSLTVTPTVADATAALKMNGVAATSGNGSTVALNVGSNTITVLVTAQDGTPNTYTITVTRAASSNADLSNLTLSQGTLSPTFASGTTTYTASVGNAVSSLTVTPTVADATAALKVNGVAATSGNGSTVALNVGSNTITVLVTAQDGTPNTYTITVTRAASSNADLSNLTLSQGTLSPTFASGTTTYTASVGNAVSSLTVTPTVADATAALKVNGVAATSGNGSTVALNVGSNTITLLVTAQDGTPNTYTVTVTRAIAQYTLTYTAAANGTITGDTTQTVNEGADGAAVTAVPASGYHFVKWSDGNTSTTRTDTNVTADIAVTAEFAINTHTLTYTAAANGTITGDTTQTVNEGADGAAVTAVTASGYHFVKWSDGNTSTTRTDTNVTADIAVTAEFAINTHTLTYTAAANGTITGDTAQTVNEGADGAAVTAVPASGYHFVKWSDNNTSATRTDKNVAANLSVTAEFEQDIVIPPFVTTPAYKDFEILINGTIERLGKIVESHRNGQTVQTVVIDPAGLKARLASAGAGATVTIPLDASNSDVVIGELSGDMFKVMEQLQAKLQIKTSTGSFTLPAKQLNLASIAAKLGATDLEGLKVRIEIAVPRASDKAAVDNAAARNGFTQVAPPVAFTITATYGDKTAEVSKFNAYVERTIALPKGIDPNKITTGVVVEPDGTVRHVPTQVLKESGTYYALINSLTNSTYSVIWHPVEFADVADHWAKAAINDLGSRMVLEGTGNGAFSPNDEITRAEFAAIIVRGLGLGLKQASGSAPFSDVSAGDWYASAVQTAVENGLISGMPDGSFHPNERITREQAMVVMGKALALTGLAEKLTGPSDDSVLNAFTDADEASEWARIGIVESIRSGLVSGRGAVELAPQANLTRAEVAQLIERLLQKSGLI
ncbi:cadherin-like beta sandwich domain-containing protein [Cohnella ginsengisoli]|uniref:Cadherin-like beta sandwich domain-containing protein n=1 Tax=Cohnella ginsengisoli TaxID=425004 RepID=A0A9X4KM48_9BACL|nr:cadherin-like beta sandwich domain-containing protein [Cohnella ginsengisoli]MDG0794819.1 cadherin-like beta sandwich domain-containing protein [Cohnella ginsengisoli]